MKLLFQPAEENPDDQGNTGLKYVVSEVVLEEADAALALHMCPWREMGELDTVWRITICLKAPSLVEVLTELTRNRARIQFR